MASVTFSPPWTAPGHTVAALQDSGFAALAPADVAAWIGCPLADLQALHRDWEALPPDEYLKDGGRYRRRRHACFIAEGRVLQGVAHRAHWQPIEYNALHGGMERWFEPMRAETLHSAAWAAVVRALVAVCDALFAPPGSRLPWFIEAHQFRIDTANGIGRPTPEGAHRDGVDLVAVFLVDRTGIKGGETRVFEASAPAGQRFTLTEPWSLLLLDDARMVHESTPIQPLEPGGGGHRDTLVVTCRRGGFQGSDAPHRAP